MPRQRNAFRSRNRRFYEYERRYARYNLRGRAAIFCRQCNTNIVSRSSTPLTEDIVETAIKRHEAFLDHELQREFLPVPLEQFGGPSQRATTITPPPLSAERVEAIASHRASLIPRSEPDPPLEPEASDRALSIYRSILEGESS